MLKSPLRSALIQGNYKLCQQLLMGKSAHRPVDGVPPLGLAVESGSLRLVKWLLSLPGVLVDSQDSEGRTPLHRFLRSEDVDFSESERLEMLNLLLARGADPSVSDERGESPSTVIQRYFPELIGLLQKHSRKELPPLREVPSAKPWRGKELRRSGLEKAGWSMVAVTAVVFTVGMMNRDRFRHTPDLGWTTGHKALWQDQYQLAQDSWKVGDYARCAGYCRVALDFGDPRIAEKGPVYALAASAYLKDGDLRGAHKVISDYDKRGPHTAALDAEIKSDRDGLGAQGQTEVERDLNQGWQAASGGDDSAAGKQLKSAQDLAVLLGLGDPAVSDCVKLKQELSRREQALNARLEAEARQHRDMRVRADGEQAHDRALEQAMRHGTVESFPFQPPPPPPTGWRSRLHGGGNDVTTTDEERSLHHHHPISVQAMFPPFTPPVAPQATQFNRRGAPQNPVMLR